MARLVRRETRDEKIGIGDAGEYVKQLELENGAIVVKAPA